MTVAFHTITTENGNRKLTKLFSSEVPAMPTEGSIFYNEKDKLSYQIKMVYFTRDRIAVVVVPHEVARLDPIEAMFPKRKVLI